MDFKFYIKQKDVHKHTNEKNLKDFMKEMEKI
jgi:hypothetical protein